MHVLIVKSLILIRSPLAMQTIINTDLADHPGKDPHHWIYKPGFSAVNEHFRRVEGPRNEHVTTDKIVINHYLLKSFEVRLLVSFVAVCSKSFRFLVVRFKLGRSHDHNM